MGALDLLEELGVEIKPGKVVGIYGPSLVGKSLLAWIIASEFVGNNGNVVVFGIEPHYQDSDYRKLAESYMQVRTRYINYCASKEDVFKYMRLASKHRFEGKVAFILDSLSYIMMYEQAKYISQGYSEPRVYVPRVVPVLYSIASLFKRLTLDKDALGLVIMHASSSAGTMKYRGLVDLRPSMAQRVLHSLDYLLLMESEGAKPDAPRKLTLIASRLTPLAEGNTVNFIFKDKTVVALNRKQ